MVDREQTGTGPAQRSDLRPLAEASLSDAVAWAVVERAPDGIVAVDEGGRVVLANDQLSSQFGYERAELLGHPIEMLVPAALRDRHRTR